MNLVAESNSVIYLILSILEYPVLQTISSFDKLKYLFSSIEVVPVSINVGIEIIVSTPSTEALYLRVLVHFLITDLYIVLVLDTSLTIIQL